MDRLTERLHEWAEAAPDGMPDAGEVRHRAERVRRNRRAGLGAATAVFVIAVLAFTVGLVGRGDGPPRLAPARPAPSPAWRAAPGSVFVADPVMSEAGWNEKLLPHTPAEHAVRTAAVPHPLDCITDPSTLGAVEVQGAAYLQPGREVPAPGGRMNVYVLWFADPAAAETAVTGLRRQFATCRSLPDRRPDDTYYDVEDWLMAKDYPLIEQQFNGEMGWQPSDGAGATASNTYDLNVARAGRLVVVWESLNGWADRRQYILGLLMDQAVAAADPRKMAAFEPDEHAYLSVIQKMDQKTGDASWRANVLDHGWSVCRVLYMGEPTTVAEHLAHWNPPRAATILAAARAHLCPP